MSREGPTRFRSFPELVRGKTTWLIPRVMTFFTDIRQNCCEETSKVPAPIFDDIDTHRLSFGRTPVRRDHEC